MQSCILFALRVASDAKRSHFSFSRLGSHMHHYVPAVVPGSAMIIAGSSAPCPGAFTRPWPELVLLFYSPLMTYQCLSLFGDDWSLVGGLSGHVVGRNGESRELFIQHWISHPSSHPYVSACIRLPICSSIHLPALLPPYASNQSVHLSMH